jgi:hypothetical protein
VVVKLSGQSRPQFVEVVGAVAKRPQELFSIMGIEPQLCAVHVNREAEAGGKLLFAMVAQSKHKPRCAGKRDLNPGDHHGCASAQDAEWQNRRD